MVPAFRDSCQEGQEGRSRHVPPYPMQRSKCQNWPSKIKPNEAQPRASSLQAVWLVPSTKLSQFLFSGARWHSHPRSFARVFPDHPTHGRVEYRRPTQFHSGQVKLHIDEYFLLKSRRVKRTCSPPDPWPRGSGRDLNSATPPRPERGRLAHPEWHGQSPAGRKWKLAHRKDRRASETGWAMPA